MNLPWKHIEKAANGDILAWAEKQPWAEPMRRCQQEPEWHAEGDVWTHTVMVWQEVERLEGYADLSRADQILLLFTALLHDSGKPATTHLDPESGRLRSPRHSIVGAALARQVLRDLGCPIEEREAIVQLVRYHGYPPHFMDRGEPDRQVIRLSWLLSNRLLHLFTLADTRGRHTADTSRKEAVLNLWKEQAQEHGCLDAPYVFANDQARFLFFREQLSSLHYSPHEDYKCTVTLMSGLPGAGKDTWLRQHCPDLPVVSLDEVRRELKVSATDNQGQVIQHARELCRQHLRAGRDFAFNATNITASLRKKWIDLFADYNARIETVYLEPSVPELLRQNRERDESVPERVIRELLDKLEIPTLTETHGLRQIAAESAEKRR